MLSPHTKDEKGVLQKIKKYISCLMRNMIETFYWKSENPLYKLQF